jgi:hypothetical protein
LVAPAFIQGALQANFNLGEVYFRSSEALGTLLRFRSFTILGEHSGSEGENYIIYYSGDSIVLAQTMGCKSYSSIHAYFNTTRPIEYFNVDDIEVEKRGGVYAYKASLFSKDGFRVLDEPREALVPWRELPPGFPDPKLFETFFNDDVDNLLGNFY